MNFGSNDRVGEEIYENTGSVYIHIAGNSPSFALRFSFFILMILFGVRRKIGVPYNEVRKFHAIFVEVIYPSGRIVSIYGD